MRLMWTVQLFFIDNDVAATAAAVVVAHSLPPMK